MRKAQAEYSAWALVFVGFYPLVLVIRFPENVVSLSQHISIEKYKEILVVRVEVDRNTLDFCDVGEGKVGGERLPG